MALHDAGIGGNLRLTAGKEVGALPLEGLGIGKFDDAQLSLGAGTGSN